MRASFSLIILLRVSDILLGRFECKILGPSSASLFSPNVGDAIIHCFISSLSVAYNITNIFKRKRKKNSNKGINTEIKGNVKRENRQNYLMRQSF